MEKEIQNIDLKKATTKNTIPPKILKISCNTSPETLQDLFNKCLITDNFPDNLKLADITPVFKKKDPLNKENYRLFNVLPSISKIFEIHAKTNKCLYKEFFISLLARLQERF